MTNFSESFDRFQRNLGVYNRYSPASRIDAKGTIFAVLFLQCTFILIAYV